MASKIDRKQAIRDAYHTLDLEQARDVADEIIRSARSDHELRNLVALRDAQDREAARRAAAWDAVRAQAEDEERAAEEQRDAEFFPPRRNSDGTFKTT